jgi:hypothetical protein
VEVSCEFIWRHSVLLGVVIHFQRFFFHS